MRRSAKRLALQSPVANVLIRRVRSTTQSASFLYFTCVPMARCGCLMARGLDFTRERERERDSAVSRQLNADFSQHTRLSPISLAPLGILFPVTRFHLRTSAPPVTLSSSPTNFARTVRSSSSLRLQRTLRVRDSRARNDSLPPFPPASRHGLPLNGSDNFGYNATFSLPLDACSKKLATSFYSEPTRSGEMLQRSRIGCLRSQT